MLPVDQTERYDDLSDRVFALYEAAEYDAALRLLDAEAAGLEEWGAELAQVRACVLALNGDPDEAVRVLAEATDAGAWWVPEILTGDDDLVALRGRPEFERVVAVSRERVSDDVVPALVELPDRPAVGVVVALHGAGQTAAHARKDWGGVLDHGYGLVCVQSSRRMSPRYRTWPDREQAAADIRRALAELQLHGPVIAAGFSAGGRAALDWALTARPAPVAGVLAVAPALRELPDAAANPLSPATVWVGTDDDLLEVVDGKAAELTAFGCTIERIPGLGHAFPAGFGELLAEAL
ncbi:alpha/beta hydrolase [Kribbella sp. NPDC004536]|uniref:alpha/beta hydrolase n=1 Tax=Kribbella sp. NPDC004536 TaxID=3364106 RepID=UPI0036ADB6E6